MHTVCVCVKKSDYNNQVSQCIPITCFLPALLVYEYVHVCVCVCVYGCMCVINLHSLCMVLSLFSGIYVLVYGYVHVYICMINVFILIVLYIIFFLVPHRTLFKRLPRINGKGVDLYLLYVVVTARGGWQKVRVCWRFVHSNYPVMHISCVSCRTIRTL